MRFDAVEYLESLFAETPVLMGHTTRVHTPDGLPAYWHLLWDERAAIVEFDGGFHREQAEAIAIADILELMQRASGEST